MKAPDKLYIGRRNYGPLIGGWKSQPFTSKEIESIEYIRKDALMEWAKVRARYYEDEILRWGLSDSSQAATFVSIASMKRLVYEDVIDKLNSL